MGQIAIVIRSNPESVSSAALVSVALFRNEVYSAVAGLRNCLPSGTVSVVVSVSPAWADSMSLQTHLWHMAGLIVNTFHTAIETRTSRRVSG